MAHLTRPNAPATRRSAFTLIELLVVVSIIALLIGILLPTLGEARRQAGIVSCVATIRGNSQGVAAYTADNRDRVPSAPPGAGGPLPNNGRSGIPSIAYANQFDNYINGWRFNPAERPNGIEYTTQPSTDRWTRLGAEAFWFIAFGNYMTETRGDAMLAEPFVSPADRATKSFWNTYKNVPYNMRTSDPDSPGQQVIAPSYWYVLPALYADNLFDIGGPFDPMGGQGGAPPSPSAFRTFHRANSIQFTSNKVAFYQYRTAHDRGVDTFWNTPINDGKGASISIAMFDGSAKNVKVFDDSQVFQPRTDETQDTGPVATAPPAFANAFRYANAPDFFRFTFGGLGGRDIP